VNATDITAIEAIAQKSYDVAVAAMKLSPMESSDYRAAFREKHAAELLLAAVLVVQGHESPSWFLRRATNELKHAYADGVRAACNAVQAIRVD
jgi:hypothetical protein